MSDKRKGAIGLPIALILITLSVFVGNYVAVIGGGVMALGALILLLIP